MIRWMHGRDQTVQVRGKFSVAEDGYGRKDDTKVWLATQDAESSLAYTTASLRHGFVRLSSASQIPVIGVVRRQESLFPRNKGQLNLLRPIPFFRLSHLEEHMFTKTFSRYGTRVDIFRRIEV
ncbi:uncharacterized protein UTRI_03732 [Ustilago trichophora]|uniref:Uncharacterized protein n=1 Tax=Ustilago trichophora TaxID=86804 RepID=A0A5C3E183_9BASI|nr:uncharacterized protein UTRI_03732 [Ustilago trichophora]